MRLSKNGRIIRSRERVQSVAYPILSRTQNRD
jgi:hypothetical protein